MPTASESLAAGAVPLRLRRWKGGEKPVLLLHGMSGNTHWWDRAAPLLSLDAAALDFRGHGESGWPADGAYSFDAFAGDAEAARLSLGWETFSVAAHSMGARAAIRYAASRPERIDRLVLVDFLAERRTGDGRFGRAMRPRQPTYSSREAALDRFRLEPPGTLLSPRQLRGLGEHCLKPAGDRWTWRFDWRCFTLAYPPVWPELAQVRAPALVVRGGHSLVMTRGDFERVVAGLADGKGVELPSAHHHVPLDAPAELARELLAFL